MESIKNSNLFQAWLVLVLATVFGITLAGVQAALGPIIEANKIQETMEKIPALVLGEDQALKTLGEDSALVIKPHRVEIDKNGAKKVYTIYEARDKDGSLAGFVAKATGQGYADKIELLLGLDAKADNITGLFVLDQKETPGLGNKIVEKQWRGQFKNKPATRGLVVVKGGAKKAYEIDAISGATISSRSVTGIVNRIILDARPQIVQPVKNEESN